MRTVMLCILALAKGIMRACRPGTLLLEMDGRLWFARDLEASILGVVLIMHSVSRAVNIEASRYVSAGCCIDKNLEQCQLACCAGGAFHRYFATMDSSAQVQCSPAQSVPLASLFLLLFLLPLLCLFLPLLLHDFLVLFLPCTTPLEAGMGTSAEARMSVS